MSFKSIKYYLAIITPLFLVSISVKAMELNYYDKDIVEVFDDATKVLLLYAGRLALLFIILGGVYYIFSGSDSQKQESAKKVITFTLLGLVLILLSYAILVALDRIGVGL